jgi:arsenate reductase
MGRKKVLFVCMNNSARSQMAEGLLNGLYGDRYLARSAGVSPKEVNPFAVRVMAEIGIDISKNRSKSIEEFRGMKFDYVVTVCDDANESCPFFPGKVQIHKSFEDPALAKGSEEEILRAFRRVRDEIREWIIQNFGGDEQDR